MDYSGLSQIVCISQDKSSAWRTQSSSIARTIKDPAFKKDMSQSELRTIQTHWGWEWSSVSHLLNCDKLRSVVFVLALSLSVSFLILLPSQQGILALPSTLKVSAYPVGHTNTDILHPGSGHLQTQSASLALSPSLQTLSSPISLHVSPCLSQFSHPRNVKLLWFLWAFGWQIWTELSPSLAELRVLFGAVARDLTTTFQGRKLSKQGFEQDTKSAY